MKKAEKINASTGLEVVSLDDLGVALKQKPLSTVGFAMWTRALLQNWRQGTVACKGRSDVAFSNRKPWKQKGTGRARAGSARSPLWRGGGVIFGPQPRVRSLSIPKKLKRRVLNDLLIDFTKKGKVVIADWQIDGASPKTAQAQKLIEVSGFKNHKVLLFLSFGDTLSYASFVNIPNIRLMFFDQTNAFDLAHNEYWMILKKDLPAFKEMVEQWS